MTGRRLRFIVIHCPWKWTFVGGGNEDSYLKVSNESRTSLISVKYWIERGLLRGRAPGRQITSGRLTWRLMLTDRYKNSVNDGFHCVWMQEALGRTYIMERGVSR